MTQRLKGTRLVSSVPQLSLQQVYPDIVGEVNLNACGDPDCGNFGVVPNACHGAYKGRGAAQRRLMASVANPVLATGQGRYRLGAPGDKGLQRVSTAFGYAGDPTAWADGRILTCKHQRGNSECRVQLLVLSNQHFEDEAARLKSQNGLLVGPKCGACGTKTRHDCSWRVSSSGSPKNIDKTTDCGRCPTAENASDDKRGRLIGCTKGGLNTKLHAVTDAKGRTMRFFMTTGQVSDYTDAAAMLGSLPAAEWLIADRGYDADWFRDALQDKGIRPCIPGRKSRGKPVKHDRRRYECRNRIEIMFGRLKD